MSGSYWSQVHAEGLAVPSDRPLDDLTAELTRMLGSPDPAQRDGTAYPTLTTWVDRGVYDDLLAGLGDGMAAGLRVGVGETDTDTVFRRSFSALVLAECIERDNGRPLLPGGKILEWGDRIATWVLRERDLRGFVPGKGWAHAVAHGADALGTLAQSPHVPPPSSRSSSTSSPTGCCCLSTGSSPPGSRTGWPWPPCRCCAATSCRCGCSSPGSPVSRPPPAPRRSYDDRDPYLVGGNAQAFLRALHLQLALGPKAPEVRSDLLLVLVQALKATNPHHLSATPE